MKILTFTTLYPNNAQARHGIFVEQRLRHLIASGEVEARVVAPVPWFPLTSARFGEYAKYAQVCKQEERHGVDVQHPRYPVLPKVGMNVAPALLAAAMLPVLQRQIRDGQDFDLIDAHYYYPDGVAAVMLGQRLGKPVVITARGNDLSLLPDYPLPRRWIRWAERRAAASITVCEALRDELIELGGTPERIHALRNGVDLELSQPVNREAARKDYGFTGTTLLTVGHLIERKGHHLVIEALQELPDVQLVVIGDGEEEGRLRQLVTRLKLDGRVRFVGAIQHAELKRYFSAADALVLASSREGLANVLLESMACGNPVIATDVWGSPEVVRSPEAGVLIPERTAGSIADGVRRLLQQYPERAATRRYAEQFSWEATTRGQIDLFRSILQR